MKSYWKDSALDWRLLRIHWREQIPQWVAWHLPRAVVMWCYVRVGAHATTGKYENTIVPELSMMDALERWGH